MPIYEYRCQKCGNLFEKIQKVDEGGKGLKCPACGEKRPERVMSCCFSSSKSAGIPSSSSSCGSGSSGFT